MSSVLKVDQIQNSNGTSGITIDSNGFIIPKAVCFSAYLSSDQSISASTWTKVAFNAEEFDTANQFDTSNHRFQPTIAGYYMLTCALGWHNGASTAALMEYHKNGSRFKLGAYLYHLGQELDDYNVESSTIIHFNGTSDYVEAYAYNVGTANVIRGGSPYTFFQGHLIGA